jgi:hypothetical protein
MKRIIGYFSFLVLILLILAQICIADRLKKVGEKGQNNQVISKEQAGAAGNRLNIDHLSDLLLRWDNYRLKGDRSGLAEIQQLIIGELRRDMAEISVQARQAKRETGQPKDEIPRDQRELRDDRRRLTEADFHQVSDDNLKSKAQIGGAQRDFKEDPCDLRDDVGDQEKAESILYRKHEIAGELINLQSQIDSGSDDGHLFREKQNDLLQEYLMLSKMEISMGYREMQENRFNLKEDCREVQKDHRSR